MASSKRLMAYLGVPMSHEVGCVVPEHIPNVPLEQRVDVSAIRAWTNRNLYVQANYRERMYYQQRHAKETSS